MGTYPVTAAPRLAATDWWYRKPWVLCACNYIDYKGLFALPVHVKKHWKFEQLVAIGFNYQCKFTRRSHTGTSCCISSMDCHQFLFPPFTECAAPSFINLNNYPPANRKPLPSTVNSIRVSHWIQLFMEPTINIYECTCMFISKEWKAGILCQKLIIWAWSHSHTSYIIPFFDACMYSTLWLCIALLPFSWGWGRVRGRRRGGATTQLMWCSVQGVGAEQERGD